MFKSVGRHLSPSLVISCAALFIALGSTGIAATGKAFILGKANSAGKTTQLTSSSAGGPTLKVTNTGGKAAAAFVTKAGKAPFTVNRTTKVTNLNADQLDGLDSSSFLAAGAKAADSDLLDGLDSSAFALAGAPFGDATTLDGLDSTAFALAGAPFGDATTLDGLDSLAFLQTSTTAGGVLAGPFSNLTLDDGAVNSAKVLDDSLGAGDLATNSVAQAEIATDGVAATEIQNDSIDAGEIVDFGLTNQDVGVLFAEVSATAVLDNHSGGVTVTRVGAVGAGQYEVDFGRNIALCTAVATIGLSGAGAPVAGEVYVADRSGDANAVFVDTNTSAGAAADRAFRLVVVC